MCVPIQGNKRIHISKAEVIWTHKKQPPSHQYHNFSADKVKIVGFEHVVPQRCLLVQQKQLIMCQQKNTVEGTIFLQ